MKNTITTFLVLATAAIASAQAFEGQVTYKNEYKSQNPKMTDAQWNSMMGTTQVYVIEGRDYKSSTNGTFFQWQLYRGAENKLYSKMSNSPAILYNDASVNSDSVLKVEHNREVAEILGYKCDELVLTCKSGRQKYYFSPKLSVDPQLFSNHKFGNWHKYLSIARALPLKTIVSTEQFTLESVATEVKPMEVDDKVLQLPADSKIEKSPY
jgi:hypothetical protein